MEYGLSALLAKYDPRQKIFQMDPFSLYKLLCSGDGGIHYKARRAKLENFEGAISNVLVNGNHWVLIYINTSEKKLFFIDSCRGSEAERPIAEKCIELLR